MVHDSGIIMSYYCSCLPVYMFLNHTELPYPAANGQRSLGTPRYSFPRLLAYKGVDHFIANSEHSKPLDHVQLSLHV